MIRTMQAVIQARIIPLWKYFASDMAALMKEDGRLAFGVVGEQIG